MVRKTSLAGPALVLAAGCLCSCTGQSGSANPAGHTASTTAPAVRTNEPDTAPAARGPQWATLPGHVVSHISSTLLISGGTGAPAYTLIGTTGNWQRQINPAATLAPATIDNNGVYAEDAVLTAAAGHPYGTTLVSVAATTPAQGLVAQQDDYYLLQYDNATGALIAKADIGPANYDQEPVPVAEDNGVASIVARESGTIILERVSLATGKSAGRVTIPDADYDDRLGSLVLLTLEKPVCDLLSAYNAGTLTKISANTICIPGGVPADEVSGGVADGFFLSPGQYSGQSMPGTSSYPFSVATGARIGDVPQASTGGLTETVGPRSTIAVAWDSGSDQGVSFDAGFYNETTWTLVYQVRHSHALGFSCSGVADNDAWVTTTSGNIVVDGMTGKQIESGWQLYPVMGGPGWTVFNGPQTSAGNPQQYLLRSSAPAVEDLASAPAPPAG